MNGGPSIGLRLGSRVAFKRSSEQTGIAGTGSQAEGVLEQSAETAERTLAQPAVKQK